MKKSVNRILKKNKKQKSEDFGTFMQMVEYTLRKELNFNTNDLKQKTYSEMMDMYKIHQYIEEYRKSEQEEN